MLLNCAVGEDSWESFGLQGDPKGNQSWIFIGRTDAEAETPTLWPPDVKNWHHWQYWKRPWCWERLKAGEGKNRGWDSWMASQTRWTLVWASSGSWWKTGKYGVLQSLGVTNNQTKIVEVMESQLSYFKSSKTMLWKCCTQYSSKFGKRSSCHRTGKCQFSFQSQKKAMPKNAQTTTQLHSSHMLLK